MSYYVVYESADGTATEGDDLASLRGWASFILWADELPLADNGSLIQLAEWGECDRLEALEEELRRAVEGKAGSPSADVLSVGRRLLELIRGRPEGCQSILVTDGSPPDDGDGGD